MREREMIRYRTFHFIVITIHIMYRCASGFFWLCVCVCMCVCVCVCVCVWRRCVCPFSVPLCSECTIRTHTYVFVL